MTAPRREPLTVEQQALASDPRHLNLASDIAGHFARDFPRLADEFHSEAGLALCTAARTFEPARKASFYTHATNRIEGAMLDVLRNSGVRGYRGRRERRRHEEEAPRVRSLDAAIPAKGQAAYDGFWTAATTIGGAIDSGEEPVGWEIESWEELKRITSRLPIKHRTVLRLLYGHAETRTMAVAARAIGASESYVSYIHTEAIQMLRS
jgi:RNA polymerase sigma factor (sigma-70 family)